MRIGLVCPYSLDVAGGVQNHVRDLAETLLATGHQVSVLAPVSEANDDASIPPYVVSAGRAVPVPYNGSVARVAFGPVSASRTRRWLRDGDFDVVHVHEPMAPSVALIALATSTAPVVATFHTAIERSRAMAAAAGILRPALDKIVGRIAVSAIALQTVVQHLGGGGVIVPNGLFVERFAGLRTGHLEHPEAPSIVFLGRFDEPRKGLGVLLEALDGVLVEYPAARLVVAGRGDVDAAVARLGGPLRAAVSFVGEVSGPDRTRLLAGADVFVAPNLGGESFGIVLVEAMAAGAPVVASDIPAFGAVCEHGQLGALFANGDADDLTRAVLETLTDPGTRARTDAAAAAVWRYDWSSVTRQVTAVYDAVTAGSALDWLLPKGPR
ncbi:MAG: glycosyltransferase family 4 protein [Actinomycetota bacterium]|nr:glycosyltransferase family 4 protein [Actinomycetota bacterium]